MNQSNQRAGGRRPASRGGSSSRPAKKKQPAAEPLHPISTPPDIEEFRTWDLEPEIQDAIAEMGIVKPTPIQALAIPPGLKRKDVIAQAETGTGKTLAFGVPMMSLIDPSRVSVLGLVLCPTRELAEQVAEVLRALGKPRNLSVALIVGGEPAAPQVKALKEGSQVVVGTPGRVLDLYQQGFLSFPWTEFVVLDEADEMLEIGFIDDVKKILSYTPDERSTLLFSATFPPDLLRLAREYTNDPAEIATASGIATVDTIVQDRFVVDERERPLALIRMIEQSPKESCFLVFCERRTDVERLMRRLEREHFSVKALHGGYDQPSRFRVMSAFRTGEVKCLVATDVASRGLDVKHVTNVVNYGPPRAITQYTHRIGRTGRAGRKGHATTILCPADMRKWAFVEREATCDIPEVEAPGRYARRQPARNDRAPRGDRPQHGDREERPRRQRDDSRGGREERPRTDRDESRGSRETQEERPRRDRDESRGSRKTQEERPRRSRDESSGSRETQEERPRRSRDESSGSREKQEERPRRSRDESSGSRETREERPRRNRDENRRSNEDRAPRGEREERPRRERDESRSSSGDRTERPARSERPERAKRPERSQPAADPAGGFGASVFEAAAASKAKPERKPAPEPAPSRREQKRQEPTPPPADGAGGFGAGI